MPGSIALEMLNKAMHIKIGIPSRLIVHNKNYPPVMGVYTSYLGAVEAAGGMPVIIPATESEEILEEMYGMVDGLLFPGGEDVSPDLYGEVPHEKLGTISQQRDFTESYLAKRAQEDKKPLVAICRGIQILNVAMGGTLYQDLEDQKNVNGHSTVEPLDKWKHMAHPISLEKDSRLASLLNTCSLEVNSIHHQAVKEVANGFRATAVSSDGIIEAIESQGDWFAIGVQCHPETLWNTPGVNWINLFKELVAAAADRKSSILS